jgi:hypothetical protein
MALEHYAPSARASFWIFAKGYPSLVRIAVVGAATLGAFHPPSLLPGHSDYSSPWRARFFGMKRCCDIRLPFKRKGNKVSQHFFLDWLMDDEV